MVFKCYSNSTLLSYHKRDTEIDILLACGEDQTKSMGRGKPMATIRPGFSQFCEIDSIA